MRPLTDTMPKPMVPLAGRALIDHALDRLVTAGITTAVVNVHYLADVLEQHLKTRAAPRVIISDERAALLDTGGGVVKAMTHFSNAPFFIHNSDTVWIEHGDSVLNCMITAFDPDRMDSVMLLAPSANSLGYDGDGDFNMDAKTGRLTRANAGTKAAYVFAGVSIAHPRLFIDTPRGAFSLNKLWDTAIARGRLYGVVLDGLWMHVGTPQALADAEAAIAADTARRAADLKGTTE